MFESAGTRNEIDKNRVGSYQKHETKALEMHSTLEMKRGHAV